MTHPLLNFVFEQLIKVSHILQAGRREAFRIWNFPLQVYTQALIELTAVAVLILIIVYVLSDRQIET